MGKKRPSGHYCKVCGMRKSNESFSGKGHAAHICKACAKLKPEQQAEQMTLNRLVDLPLRRLTDSELRWLRNRTHDRRPEVRETARSVYAERFPHAVRNAKKQELTIKTLDLFINGEVLDEDWEPVLVQETYHISRQPPEIVCIDTDGTSTQIEPPPQKLTKLCKWAVHTLEIYWWGEDYCRDEDDDWDWAEEDEQENDDQVEEDHSDPDSYTWRVHVEYRNGEIQDTFSDGYIPDPILALLERITDIFA